MSNGAAVNLFTEAQKTAVRATPFPLPTKVGRVYREHLQCAYIGGGSQTPRLAGARPRQELQGYPPHDQGKQRNRGRHGQTASCFCSGSIRSGCMAR
jgi:hypothetical protein